MLSLLSCSAPLWFEVLGPQESEGEEAGESRVTLAQDLGRGNLAARQSRVQLQEVRLLRFNGCWLMAAR